MNKRMQWTQINTEDTNADTGEEFRLDLAKEVNGDDVEEIKENGKEQSQDTRRGLVTGSTSEKNKAQEDDEDVTEEAESKEERKVWSGKSREAEVEDTESEDDSPRKGRAHKRIQNLLVDKRTLSEEVQRRDMVIARLLQEKKANERSSATAQKEAWEQAITDKKAALEEAVNRSDGKEVARLAQEVADATMRFNAFTAVEEEYEEEDAAPPQFQRQAPPPAPPEAAKEWINRNPWFKTDEKRHVVARLISRDLTQEGELDPNDDEYWQELDRRMAGLVKDTKESKATTAQTPPTRSKGSPLGSRSGDEDAGISTSLDRQFTRKGNTVSATPTQGDYDMAERLNVGIKDYMKEKFKYAEQGYKGYVTIDIPGQ